MKTPEEMAEEYVAHNRSYPYDPLNAQDRYMRNSYLVGYKAGCENTQTQLAVGEKTIRELLGKSQWISVKDRLPEVGKEILWYHQPGGEFAVGYLLDEATQPFFTHWMELPAPPKEEK